MRLHYSYSPQRESNIEPPHETVLNSQQWCALESPRHCEVSFRKAVAFLFHCLRLKLSSLFVSHLALFRKMYELYFQSKIHDNHPERLFYIAEARDTKASRAWCCFVQDQVEKGTLCFFRHSRVDWNLVVVLISRMLLSCLTIEQQFTSRGI